MPEQPAKTNSDHSILIEEQSREDHTIRAVVDSGNSAVFSLGEQGVSIPCPCCPQSHVLHSIRVWKDAKGYREDLSFIGEEPAHCYAAQWDGIWTVVLEDLEEARAYGGQGTWTILDAPAPPAPHF